MLNMVMMCLVDNRTSTSSTMFWNITCKLHVSCNCELVLWKETQLHQTHQVLRVCTKYYTIPNRYVLHSIVVIHLFDDCTKVKVRYLIFENILQWPTRTRTTGDFCLNHMNDHFIEPLFDHEQHFLSIRKFLITVRWNSTYHFTLQVQKNMKHKNWFDNVANNKVWGNLL